MAVYTEISPEQASVLIGTPVLEILPLAGGIENSNYRVRTADGALVLTVIERQDPARIAAPLRWMDALHAHGLPVPRLLSTDLEYAGKPVVLSSWCQGEHRERLDPAHAGAVGALLGEMHLHPPAAPLAPDAHDEPWLETRVTFARTLLSGADLDALERGWALYRESASMRLALPHGAIHADVFRDNLLFDGDTVSGLLDFHYACTGPLVYDLAIAANDLCTRADGGVDRELEAALLWGYKGVRRPHGAEDEAWDTMCALAAFRYWMSRSYDRAHPRPGPLPHTKDPDEFRSRYLRRLSALP